VKVKVKEWDWSARMLRIERDGPTRLHETGSSSGGGTFEELAVEILPPFDEHEQKMVPGKGLSFSASDGDSAEEMGVSKNKARQVAEKAWGDLEKNRLRFLLENCDASIANALRRIMISEVPTVAVEQIGMLQNTSILPDEMLAQRIGMVPINVDASFMENEKEFLNFDMSVMAREKPINVYSSSLVCKLDESQKQRLEGKQIPRPVHDDILLAKLLPGQRIHLRAACRVGVGATHARWSPVATAYYRLVPKVEILNTYPGEEIAHKLREACPRDVFDIEDGELRITNSERCSMCRECVRRDEFEGLVDLQRYANKYIFVVETAGAIPPIEILKHAIGVLKAKATKFITEMENL